MVTVFCPLVDVTVDPRNGTELLPDSHNGAVPEGGTATSIRPALAAGEILMFDYRCWHRGLANKSRAARPVVYLAYRLGGAMDELNTAPSDAPSLRGGGSS